MKWLWLLVLVCGSAVAASPTEQLLTDIKNSIPIQNSLLAENGEKLDTLILISLAVAIGVGALLGFAAWFVVLRAMTESEF